MIDPKKADAFRHGSSLTAGRALICTKNSGEEETEVGLPVVSCVMRSACCLTSRRDTSGCAAVNLFTRICAIIAVIRITPVGWPFNYRLLCSPLCVRTWEYVPME